jgi:hypothetical protein
LDIATHDAALTWVVREHADRLEVGSRFGRLERLVDDDLPVVLLGSLDFNERLLAGKALARLDEFVLHVLRGRGFRADMLPEHVDPAADQHDKREDADTHDPDNDPYPGWSFLSFHVHQRSVRRRSPRFARDQRLN